MLERSLQVVGLLHLANPSLGLSHPKPQLQSHDGGQDLGSVAVPAGDSNCCTLSDPCPVCPYLSLQLRSEDSHCLITEAKAGVVAVPLRCCQLCTLFNPCLVPPTSSLQLLKEVYLQYV